MTKVSLKSLMQSNGSKARAQKAKSALTAPGRYTYKTTVDCEGGTTHSKYKLRRLKGTYEEDLCGDEYEGKLKYVEVVTLDSDAGPIAGWVYNGKDDSGEYGYFFSIDQVPGLGAYIVLVGDVHSPGNPYLPFNGWLATRS